MERIAHMSIIHKKSSVIFLAFVFTPCFVGIYCFADCKSIPDCRINACLVILREELVSGVSRIDGTVALAMSANGFPVALALRIGIPEGVDFIVVASLGIFLGGVAIEDAFELGFNIISCWLLAHGGDISTQMEIGNEIIQNLSKSIFLNPTYEYNYELLLIIFLVLLAYDEAPLRGPLFVKANAFLKCCANPFDETAFLLAHKGLGINAETYAACRLEAAQSGKSAWQAWLACLDEEEHANIPGPETRVSEAKKLFAGGFYCFDPQDGAGAEFIEWLDSYTDQFPLANIGEYLYWLALVDVQDEIEPWDDSERMVTLMTCHASKGLEFPVVIVAGCNEGILPGKQAIKAGEAAIEDERRLMYVAVTRAKGLLQLAVRPVDKVVMETSGTQQAEPPSRFLKEMGIPQSSE